MSYKVKLPIFEGPFDLLVYLIENSQMSIYDIEIAQITDEYLKYTKELQKENFQLGMEFMVLASTLLDIKARMVLPRQEKNTPEEKLEDPRSQLVDRLLEYKKVKACAQILEEKYEKAQQIYEKPQEDISEYTNAPDEYLKLDIDSFAKAFEAFLWRKQKLEQVRERYERLEREKATLEDRMSNILALLQDERYLCNEEYGFKFNDMSWNNTNYQVVTSFMAVLQLTREKKIHVYQKELYGDIWVKLKGE